MSCCRKRFQMICTVMNLVRNKNSGHFSFAVSLFPSRTGLRRGPALHGPGRPGELPRSFLQRLCQVFPLHKENGRRGVLPALPGPPGVGAEGGLHQLLQAQRGQKHLLCSPHARHALRGHVFHLRVVGGDRLHRPERLRGAGQHGPGRGAAAPLHLGVREVFGRISGGGNIDRPVGRSALGTGE